MPKDRVLITVKTYPTLSRKYGETVCTAGVKEDGSWVRIYPVPFRRLEDEQQYSKYDWVEVDLIKAKKDVRPETRHPADMDQLTAVGNVGTSDKWRERRRLILEKGHVYTRIPQIIEAAKSNNASLAVFKPSKLIEFVVEEEEEREWSSKKLKEMRNLVDQGDLFDEQWRKTFRVIPKLPFNFSYRFSDADGRESTMQILDWEIGALYWNCFKRYERMEKIAIEKVRQKYWDDFSGTDLHLFLGTTLEFHFRAPNPWTIVGVFPIPKDPQGALAL